MRLTAIPAALIVVLVGCGGDDDGGTATDAPGIDAAELDAPGTDAPELDAPGIDAPGAFALTSTVITEGGVIPDMYSCQGTNVSPPLAWTGGPTAPGYAIVFTDNSNGLIHSVIWDIPGNVMSLPENVAKLAEPPVPAGSKQTTAYDNQTRGYLGPCPGSTHTYEFALYAIDEYPLTGVTLQSSRTAARTAIMAHDTAVTRLTATFTP
jgi:Raf kinase inhibitor-like YbhB/YbcL family protein